MKSFIKTIFGLGVIVGMVLLFVGFMLYLFGAAYRIAVAMGTLLCTMGWEYAQICETEEEEK